MGRLHGSSSTCRTTSILRHEFAEWSSIFERKGRQRVCRTARALTFCLLTQKQHDRRCRDHQHWRRAALPTFASGQRLAWPPPTPGRTTAYAEAPVTPLADRSEVEGADVISRLGGKRRHRHAGGLGRVLINASCADVRFRGEFGG